MQSLEIVMIIGITAVVAVGVFKVGQLVQKWGREIIALAINS